MPAPNLAVVPGVEVPRGKRHYSAVSSSSTAMEPTAAALSRRRTKSVDEPRVLSFQDVLPQGTGRGAARTTGSAVTVSARKR